MTAAASTDRRWRLLTWGGIAALLLIPAIAMRFTTQVAWDAADFIVAAVLLGAVGAALEVTLHLSDDPRFRAAMAVALATALVLVWACLAVGFFGAEGTRADAAQLLVLGTAVLGAGMSRGRPLGMKRAMAWTAVVQLAVSVAGALAGWPVPWIPTFGLCALWVVSSRLFSAAAHRTNGSDDELAAA